MAQVVCELANSRLESLSAGGVSGASLSLVTGFSQTQPLQPVSGEQTRGGREGGSGGKEGGDGRGRKTEGRATEEERGTCGAPRAADGALAKISTLSPSSSSEDGVRSLLENVPRVGEEFEVLAKIGEGTFSSVFLGRLRGLSERQFALKHLVPTSACCRIENELRCLQSMGGRDNVIPLLTSVRHRDHVVLIMPYFPHTRLTDYLHLMTPAEVQRYMQALFTALRNVHSHHVIHRDIKPSNFLYDRGSGRFQLVDFGLAHLESSRSATSASSSSSTQKSCPRSGHATAQQSFVTPPTSSSAHTATPGTQQRPHPQVHMNGTPLLPPPPTYRRQVYKKLHPQSSTEAGTGEERGKRAGRKRGKEGEECGEERSRDEGRVCPLRHKKTELCDVCQNRVQQTAPRAGTPGFRAPEVLLKCPHQTTAVDIWSAGVILLCLLSGRYPFFRASDDLSALAQIIALMGSTECTRVSREMGKELVCGQELNPVNLRELCQTLRSKLHGQQPSPATASRDSFEAAAPPPSKRNRLASATAGGTPTTSPSCHYELRSPRQHKSPRRARTLPRSNPPSVSISPLSPTPPSSCSLSGGGVGEVAMSWESLPESAYDLLGRCLELNPERRLSAEQALQHPFLADVDR